MKTETPPSTPIKTSPEPGQLPHPFSAYTATSSISDIAKSEDLSTRHRAILNRKSWKLTKSAKEKKEAVWPDFLEQALLEALAAYRPTSSKDPGSLRRFPKRNAFIAKFIKQKTNVKRTAKQVGSRLQQLRETCTEPAGMCSHSPLIFFDAYRSCILVLYLICSRDFDHPDRMAAIHALLPGRSVSSRTAPDLRIDTAAIPDYSPTSSNTTPVLTPSMSMESMIMADPYDYNPVTPYSDSFDQQSIRSSPSSFGGSWPHAYAQITLVTAPGSPYVPTQRPALESNTGFTLDLDESCMAEPQTLSNPATWKFQRRLSVATSFPVCYHTPTVTLSSSILSPLVAYESSFRVQKGQKVLYAEQTRLEHISDSDSRPYLFRGSLVPKYWGIISNKTSELNQYIIVQDIFEAAAAADCSTDPIYTIVYNFECSVLGSDVPESTSYLTSAASFNNQPYQASPNHPSRIPLAPILQNIAPVSPDLDYGLLHPIQGSSDVQVGGSWYTSNGYITSEQYYTPTPYPTPNGQTSMDNEQLAYPILYPF